ncbi:MAG: HipA domain-containing protein [Bacteroidales bacterium]|nr:HipA domain-containing protein [Bacteroidales bacterium]
MNRCLYCYKELAHGEHDYHVNCIKKGFGTKGIPTIPYSRYNINDLARNLVLQQTTITGVQPKLSLHLAKNEKNEPDKFTLVGMAGNYILKPQSKIYPNLPENEDLTMHLAELSGINVVPHTLARMADGELCYLTQRVDRNAWGQKIAMEDTCQLSERLTEDKYHSSYEQVAKIIKRYSNVGKLDLVNYWELVMFCYLTGNSDMHLKNFSLYMPHKGQWKLAPAYDLLNVRLVMPTDKDELALTLNGKRSNIKQVDFISAMEKSEISPIVGYRMIGKFAKLFPKWEQCIKNSFLHKEQQAEYINYISQMLEKISPLTRQ